MKILIASGSFKDVYTSMQACEMINSIIPEYRTEIAPLCDGGEYTFETIKYYFQSKTKPVRNVLNPYCQNINTEYIILEDEAFIISSKVLHLNQNEEKYKNPLYLTDYGLGQLVNDAIQNGYKIINICLGGTSTVCAGIGFAQALGARIFDTNNEQIINPVLGKDLIKIKKIDFDKKIYKDIKINIICDGIPSASKMDIITNLKISKLFDNSRGSIFNQINEGIKNISDITKSTIDKDYSGAAGAMRFGIDSIFNANYCKGGDYFYKLFSIDDKIKNSDIIITGEGRFDNPRWGKTPVTVSRKAKKYGKKVIFLSGLHDKSMFTNNDYIMKNDTLRNLGIDTLISCQKYYDENNLQTNNLIKYYKKITPQIFGKYLVQSIEIL